MSQGCYFVNKKNAWSLFILCQVGKCLILLVSVSRLSFPPFLLLPDLTGVSVFQRGEPKN
jgi:hypothetical protein